MKIGLIIATEEEFETLVQGFNVQPSEEKDDVYHTFLLNINEHEVYVAKSGVGEIAASSLTQYLITKYDVKLILNYGVVGALKPNLKINDCAVLKSVVHYDFDISGIDEIDEATYPEVGSYEIPLTRKYIKLVKKLNPQLPELICASGDKFISDSNFKNYLVSKFNADICDMESAGIVLTALKNGVEVFSLKGVSDTANDEEYNSFAKRTCEVLFKVLKEILFSL